MKYQKLINLVTITAILCWFSACTSEDSIAIDTDEIIIDYIYSSESLINASYSIKRKIKIRKKSDNTKLDIELLPDIENIDNPRFQFLDSIQFDGKKYENLLIIEDPFALVIIDLNEMTTLYNGHGEDNMENRLLPLGEVECIGKIKNKALTLNDCAIDLN